MEDSVCVIDSRMLTSVTSFRSRECYDAGIHRQSLAGIQGTKAKGAFSIVISCYYEDDEDFGDKIIYTGAGGRSSKSGWPTPRGLRVCDQEWSDQGNEALLKSRETGKPVRVVRSSKFVSAFSPVNGYRYDGLYTVTHARREMNKDGLYICRYDMERIPGQPPLPRRRSRASSCIEPRSSPVSVATSDTVFSPSRESISRKLNDYSEDDPPIYANARPYKDRGFHRVSYLPPPSSSPAAQSSAPAPVTFQCPPSSTGRSLVRDVDMPHHSDEDEEQEQGDSDSNLGSGEKEKEDPDLDDSPGPYVSSTSSFGTSQSQL